MDVIAQISGLNNIGFERGGTDFYIIREASKFSERIYKEKELHVKDEEEDALTVYVGNDARNDIFRHDGNCMSGGNRCKGCIGNLHSGGR